MINPNKFIGLQQQESMGPLTDPLQAEQDFLAKRMSQPVAVPGNQNQTMSPVMQINYPHTDPNKGKPYVVNERPGVWQPGTKDRRRDTLFLPQSMEGQKGKMIDEDDYVDNAKINKEEYFQVGVQDLEDQGKIKIRQ